MYIFYILHTFIPTLYTRTGYIKVEATMTVTLKRTTPLNSDWQAFAESSPDQVGKQQAGQFLTTIELIGSKTSWLLSAMDFTLISIRFSHIIIRDSTLRDYIPSLNAHLKIYHSVGWARQ